VASLSNIAGFTFLEELLELNDGVSYNEAGVDGLDLETEKLVELTLLAPPTYPCPEGFLLVFLFLAEECVSETARRSKTLDVEQPPE